MKDLKFYVWKEDFPGRATTAFDDFTFKLFFNRVTFPILYIYNSPYSLELTTTKSEKADIYRFVSDFYELRYRDGRLSKLRDALSNRRDALWRSELKTLDTYEKCYFDRYYSVVKQVIYKVPAELRGKIYAQQPPSKTRLGRTTSYVGKNHPRNREKSPRRDTKRRRLNNMVKFI